MLTSKVQAQGEVGATAAEATAVRLTTRRQMPKTTGRVGWQVIEEVVVWRASETAIVIVDMWDTHWSRGAVERVNVLAPRINVVVSAARARGIQIIHAPSDVVEGYADHPARRRVASIPHSALPAFDIRQDPPLPIDDSDEGSDTGEQTVSLPWTRQHAAIDIAAGDLISADGQEIYNILRYQGIAHLIYMGVHTNMCVLNRPFGIKRMVRYGFTAVLARDLTDSMYNPLRRPYVSHDEGTQLVIGYIEKFWCPTIASDDLTIQAESRVT